MGSGYSAEQKKDFDPYRMLIDKAVLDPTFTEFQLVRDKLCADLNAKKPFS